MATTKVQLTNGHGLSNGHCNGNAQNGFSTHQEDVIDESKRRIITFSAGPAQMPLAVLKKAQDEMLDFNGTGCSVMELSHRSAEFTSIIKSTEAKLRQLAEIPSNYKVLFLTGGGTGNFASVPLNFLNLKPSKSADYIVTGMWSEKAAKEAAKYGTVNHVIPQTKSYIGVDESTKWNFSADASYVFMCANETIQGVQFKGIPDCGDVPIVCDMSSEILSKPFDVTKFGCIMAGAQKNIGIAGVTIIIVREDLLNHALPITPSIMDFTLQAKAGSVLNTPPCYAIYMTGLVFEWIESKGGATAMLKQNDAKARLLYRAMDDSQGFYECPILAKWRSDVNIPFRVGGGSVDLEKLFVKEAAKVGLVTLDGHRSVGGCRASIYNACTLEHVSRLVAFMKDFHSKNGGSSKQ